MNAPDAARPVEAMAPAMNVPLSANANTADALNASDRARSNGELPSGQGYGSFAPGRATAEALGSNAGADWNGRPGEIAPATTESLAPNGAPQSLPANTNTADALGASDRSRSNGALPGAQGSGAFASARPPADAVGSSSGPFDNGRTGEIAPATTVSITPNNGTRSPSESDGADQSTNSFPEDYQDATYTPVQPTTVLSANGQPMGVQLGSSGDGSRLDGLRPGDLSQMSRKDIDDALPSTDLSKVSEESKRWLIENNFANDALKEFSDKGNSDSVQAELAEGYALSGLSQAVIRDVGPPTAVQVRISAPDKL
jgi:hypothetical protein